MAKQSKTTKQTIDPDVTLPPEERAGYGADPIIRRNLGLVLSGLGAFFLFQTLTDFDHMDQTWPLILVVIGAMLVVSRGDHS